jgi:hypothetical protein
MPAFALPGSDAAKITARATMALAEVLHDTIIC